MSGLERDLEYCEVCERKTDHRRGGCARCQARRKNLSQGVAFMIGGVIVVLVALVVIALLLFWAEKISIKGIVGMVFVLGTGIKLFFDGFSAFGYAKH